MTLCTVCSVCEDECKFMQALNNAVWITGWPGQEHCVVRKGVEIGQVVAG